MRTLDSNLTQQVRIFIYDNFVPDPSSNFMPVQKGLKDVGFVILRDLQEFPSTLVREIYTDNITRRIIQDSSGIHLITGDRKIRKRSVFNQRGKTE